MHACRSWRSRLTVIALAAIACGGDRTPTTITEVKPDTGVTPPVALAIKVCYDAYLAAGDSLRMAMYIRYVGQEENHYRDGIFSLAVRDTSLARVDSLGYLHAGARVGRTWVVGTRGTLIDSASVDIWTPAFYLSPDTSVVPLGTSRTLLARSFSKSTGPTSTAATGWASSDAAVVTVDEQGRLTPRSVGRATISANAGLARATTEVVVTAYEHPLSFTSVTTSFGIACGVEADGTAYCWGSRFQPSSSFPVADRCETFSQTLSDRPWNRSMGRCALTPVKLPTTVRFQQTDRVSSGDPLDVPLFLSKDGDLYSLGARLSTSGRYRWATGIGMLFCGIRADDTGWCFGYSIGVALGFPQPGIDTTPKPLPGGLRLSELHVGYDICGLTTTGQAYCWAKNLPTAVRTDARFATLAVGGLLGFRADHCGIDLGGDTWCWGAPPAGVDPLAPEAAPARITTAPRFASLRGPAICGRTVDGAAYCLARNESATTMATRYSFVRLPLPFAAALLEVNNPACAKSAADGVVYCWGGSANQGDGSVKAATVDQPARVAGQAP